MQPKHRLSLLPYLYLTLAACTAPGATTDGASTGSDTANTSSDTDSTGAAHPTTSVGTETETGAPSTTDGETETGAESTTDGETETGTESTTGAEECPPQTGTFGAAGGELSLCGAILQVPADAVASDVVFGIEVVTPPADPPFEQAFASPVFRFTPTDTAFMKPIALTLPRPVTSDRIALGRYYPVEQRFGIVEACEVTDTTISQSVFELGTFATLRGTYPYPDGTTDLGGGSLELEIFGAPASFVLDVPNSFGIFADIEGGGRIITVKSVREVDGGVESLRIDFAVDAEGTGASLTSVEFLSTVLGGGYTFIDGLIGSGGTITLDVAADDHYVGELSATAHGGNPPHDEPLHVSFDITVEKFVFPPELSCLGGE